MRNPLHFSSQRLVKRALEDYNAQYKDTLNTENIAGAQDFWKNIQSYPQDVQKKIYDQMGQITVPGNTYGGFGNMLKHKLSQGWHAAGDLLGQYGNSVAEAWGGGRTDLTPELGGNDVIARSRDDAQRVYDLALQNPEYMARLQANIPQYTQTIKNEASQLRANQANPPSAPTPATRTYSGTANPAIGSGGPGIFNTSNIAQQTTAPAPTPAQNAPISPNRKTIINAAEFTDSSTPAQQTPAPAQPVAPQQANNRAQAIASKFLAGGYAPNAPQPTLPAAQAQVAQPVAQAAPIPTPAQPAAPTPNTAPTTLVSAAKPAAPSVQPTPQPAPQPTAQPAPQSATPWTDPNSKFDKNWSADQRAQYIRAKYK
jgi:hypothetical protein